MAVDVKIGTVETVIQAGPEGRDRSELIAAAVAAMRAELDRRTTEDARRTAESAIRPRSFGQRY